jgi:hypothetical protein
MSNTSNPWHFIIASEILLYEITQVIASTTIFEISAYSNVNWYLLFAPTLIFIFTRPLKRLNELKK